MSPTALLRELRGRGPKVRCRLRHDEVRVDVDFGQIPQIPVITSDYQSLPVIIMMRVLNFCAAAAIYCALYCAQVGPFLKQLGLSRSKVLQLASVTHRRPMSADVNDMSPG